MQHLLITFIIYSLTHCHATSQTIKLGVLNALKQLNETTRVGLITYSNIISVYDLSLRGIASAYVINGRFTVLNVYIIYINDTYPSTECASSGLFISNLFVWVIVFV